MGLGFDQSLAFDAGVDSQSIAHLTHIPHTAVDEGVGDVQLLSLPGDFYAEASAANPYKCTEEERSDYAAALGRPVMERLCDPMAYAQYAALDRAFSTFLVPCTTCTHAFVINGNKSYAPDFLGLAERQPEDLIVVGFVHNVTAVIRYNQPGRVDLGAIVLRRQVLDGGRRLFLASLPESAHARELGDADFWFLKTALDRGFTQAS